MESGRPSREPTPDRRTPRRRRGDGAEALVADWLTEQGWSILAASVRVGRDELDLIAQEPGTPATIVFVEVRSRTSPRFGAPEETIDGAKIGRVYRAAMTLLRQRTLPDGRALGRLPWRVDLVVVDARAWRPGASDVPELRHLRGVSPY